VGVNPVQVEIGEFDEAIELVEEEEEEVFTESEGAFTPKAKRCFRATESHEKSTYVACGCDRRDIFPGGVFGATRCGRRVFRGTIFAPS